MCAAGGLSPAEVAFFPGFFGARRAVRL